MPTKKNKPHGISSVVSRGTISKADRRAATLAYEQGPREDVIIGPICACSQYNFPHEAHTDERGIFDYHRSLRYVQIGEGDKLEGRQVNKNENNVTTTNQKQELVDSGDWELHPGLPRPKMRRNARTPRKGNGRSSFP